VLAVGDAAFQKKCMGKMGEVAEHGRTVLLVSHNMAVVRSLCSRGIVLNKGRVTFSGSIERAVVAYNEALALPHQAASHSEVEFSDIRVNAHASGAIAYSEPFEVTCQLDVHIPMTAFILCCTIDDGNGEPIVVGTTTAAELRGGIEAGTYELRVMFPTLWLKPGVYALHFKLVGTVLGPGNGRFLSDSVTLDVVGNGPSGKIRGYLTPEIQWGIQPARPAVQQNIGESTKPVEV
jgi:lipopolysaccharide transport system ATP-binding protein